GRAEEAEKAYRQGIDIAEALVAESPKDADCERLLTDAYAGLGASFTAAGRKRQANEVYAKVLKLLPDQAGALNGLACRRVTDSLRGSRVRDGLRAVAWAKRATERAPAAGHIWNTLGVAHYRAGNWKEAVAALDKSMELEGLSSAPHPHYLHALV